MIRPVQTMAIPRITLPTACVFMQEGGEVGFEVELKDVGPQLTLVADIYPSVAPRHPERHLGWFQFGDLCNGRSTFQLAIIDGAVRISSHGGCLPIAQWVNENPETTELFPLALRVVLRNKLNNAIAYEDVIVIFSSQEQFRQRQQYFEQRRDMLPQGVPFQAIVEPDHTIGIVVKELRDYDAVGSFSWETQALLVANGIKAELFVERCDDTFRPFVRNVHELLDRPHFQNMTLFYQYSIMDKSLDWICSLPCRKIAYFHGITTPGNLRIFDGELARACEEGLRQIPLLASFDKIIANSRFTWDVLASTLPEGDRTPCVLPPLVSAGSIWDATDADPVLSERFANAPSLLLYVGRMFPNKRVEDLLAVFARYLELDPAGCLVLVGGAHTSYQRYLEYKVSLMPEPDRCKIIFLPRLTKSELKAMYQRASCFITMSAHEGFCIPLVEAMRFGVPIVARDCTAIPEVLKGAGKLFQAFSPVAIACEIDRLHRDSVYRNHIICKQFETVSAYSDEKMASQLLDAILR